MWKVADLRLPVTSFAEKAARVGEGHEEPRPVCDERSASREVSLTHIEQLQSVESGVH